jgi:GNAT superfamily N-acetyltransferase
VSSADVIEAVIRRAAPITQTARTLQLSGIFDLPPSERIEQSWQVRLDLPDQWNVGLIVGPSGCGKSTIAREFWPERLTKDWPWPDERSILDGFPADMSIKDITDLMCSVGFSSPPSWLKPFRILSNGEQFRVNIARALAEHPDLTIVDEFTSVVDRTVAKIASAAVAKAIRRRRQKFIALTCHYDVAEWLEPDWIYQPATGEFLAGRLLRRPQIELEVILAHSQAWKFFKAHHYLSGALNKSAACFVALALGRPAAFCAVLSQPHAVRPAWREHRTVCLPDFQGVGVGSALAEYVAALYAATGKPYNSVTSHPGYIAHRLRSPLWRQARKLSLCLPSNRQMAMGLIHGRVPRLTASFEFIGSARHEDARRFGVIP